MLPSHNSGSSLLNQETTITGPRVEGTCIHHQANQQKNMKGKTQRNTNMFFDLLQSKAQKKKNKNCCAIQHSSIGRYIPTTIFKQQINTLPIDVPDREVQAGVSESGHQLLRRLPIQWHTQEEHTIYIFVPWKNINPRDSPDLCSFGSQNKELKLEAWQE